MLTTLASFSFRHRYLVLLGWIVALISILVLSGRYSGEFFTGGNLPGADSTQAYDLRAAEFPEQGIGETVRVVVHAEQGIAAIEDDIAAFGERLSEGDGVSGIQLPRATSGPEAISAEGTIGLGSFSVDPGAAGFDPGETFAAADELRRQGIDVEYANYLFVAEDMPASELAGIIAAVLILLIAFGSVVAMGLPMITALVGVAIGAAGVGLWANAITTPDFAGPVASMIGLGVGIDYALFIVTRYRSALGTGADPHAATLEAIGTAGRAVVFAGATVMISLMGMLSMGINFFNGLAIATASAVAVAVLAALTLLPALLGIIGRRIDRFSWHRPRHQRQARETVWHRWSRLVQRHPKGFALGGFAALLIAGLPVLGLRMAFADMGNDPRSTTTRRAYDLRAEGFGAGMNGPLIVVAATNQPVDTSAVEALSAAVADAPGVGFVGAVETSASGRAAQFVVIPTTGPQAEETEDLVHRLRDDLIHNAGVIAHVGGATASDIDFSAKMAQRLPVFIGAVLMLSFLLLMAVFRSVLVPLKAVVLNLLSIAAAYGVMVAVFQWGWFGSFFDITPAPIEPWAPMMLFAIVFGLSMDYEVFLLSSIHERFVRTGDNSHAVVEGLASTARVITAAAAIMVCVFLPFVFGDSRGIKLIGLGLAAAVFVDATIVRMVLVPATMELLGRRNWWMPAWLDRVVPRVAVESAEFAPVAVAVNS